MTLESLFQIGANLGQQIYGDAIWKVDPTIHATVPVGPGIVVQASDQYPGSYTLAITDGKRTMYCPIKSSKEGADKAALATSFTLQQATALRDWPEYNIKAGETKLFAIPVDAA